MKKKLGESPKNCKKALFSLQPLVYAAKKPVYLARMHCEAKNQRTGRSSDLDFSAVLRLPGLGQWHNAKRLILTAAGLSGNFTRFP